MPIVPFQDLLGVIDWPPNHSERFLQLRLYRLGYRQLLCRGHITISPQ